MTPQQRRKLLSIISTKVVRHDRSPDGTHDTRKELILDSFLTQQHHPQHQENSAATPPLALAWREEKIMKGKELMARRLSILGLTMVVVRDDGDCMFSSLAHQLGGTKAADTAAGVRQRIVQHMMTGSSSGARSAETSPYRVYFETKAEWEEYINKMSMAGGWGDAICLRAAAAVYNAYIHVLSSETENYYIVFRPPEASSVKEEEEHNRYSSSSLHLFLAYISPIHYNSLCYFQLSTEE